MQKLLSFSFLSALKYSYFGRNLYLSFEFVKPDVIFHENSLNVS